jgi:hypothetical protein
MTSRPENKFPRSSSFYSYDNCEASFSLSQMSGEEPPTPFSDRGTAIHGWLAADIDRKPVLEEDELDTARDLALQENELFESWHRGEIIEAHREERLWLRDGLQPIYSGKPDVWYVSDENRVLVPDYKSGWHPLDHYVASNCQLRSYVPLIDEELDRKPENITVAILKPGKKFPPARFDREEIDAAREWAISVARRSTDPGPKHPTRGEWCKYCAGKVICPAWKTEIEELSDLITARITDIPDSALNALAPRLQVAKTVIEKLQERLYYRVREKPEHFPDWRFEAGNERRNVTPESLFSIYDQLVSKNADLTFTEFMECCKISLGELEKRVRKNKKMRVREVYVYLDKAVGQYIETKRNKPTLVYDPKFKHEDIDAPEPEGAEEQPLPDREEGFGESEPAGAGEEGNLEPGEIA